MAYKGDAPLVDMVFNASADMVDYNLSIIFASQKSSGNYLRIQVTFLLQTLSLSLSTKPTMLNEKGVLKKIVGLRKGRV
jgi:hypothetical protein